MTPAVFDWKSRTGLRFETRHRQQKCWRKPTLQLVINPAVYMHNLKNLQWSSSLGSCFLPECLFRWGACACSCVLLATSLFTIISQCTWSLFHKIGQRRRQPGNHSRSETRSLGWLFWSRPNGQKVIRSPPSGASEEKREPKVGPYSTWLHIQN